MHETRCFHCHIHHVFEVIFMKVVIVGNGKVGNSLADRLSSEGHEVVVIDNDP